MRARIALAALAISLATSPLYADPASRPTEHRPLLELRAGEKFFRADGKPVFLLGRNPIGVNPDFFRDQFKQMSAAGERFVRIHFTYMPPGEKAGEVHPNMLQFWDAVLDAAEKEKLGVLPVLGVWADWNDGSNKETWHTWDRNPFNAALGGPARNPAELLQDDSVCQRLWLKRQKLLVDRWKGRKCVVGWEIFSEIDLLTGTNEKKAIAFAQKAATQIRAADVARRPVTISQAGTNEWPGLLGSDAVDLVQVHPYGDAARGELDTYLLTVVRARLRKYGKPVLIGECGLDSAPPRGTLDVALRAEIGIRHAIWASVVSGAVSGRMLWWQDGYDQFEKADLHPHYQKAAAAAAAFVQGIDYAGFVPIESRASEGIRGATLGDTKRLVLGFYRDARCAPPRWPEEPLAGQSVTVPVANGTWRIELVGTSTVEVIEKREVIVNDRVLRIAFPELRGSIAFRAAMQVK
jgi:hypothetical protein